jgi:uncharacterized protein (DUF2252 family)
MSNVAERRQAGKAMRKKIPRSSHADWSPPANRRNPVDTVTSQNESRLSWLVPVRHWRMQESAFAFYRGGAKVMAADLAALPVTGLTVQACGDAHLSNFGVFGSPERQLLFDVNDFDETLAGPWEWDVKRLAASVVIAGRYNEFDASACTRTARAAVECYRQAMAKFATMRAIDVWYAQLTADDLAALVRERGTKKERKRMEKGLAKAQSQDSLRLVPKLTEVVDGRVQIVDDSPFVMPFRTLSQSVGPAELETDLRQSSEAYLVTLPDNIRRLMARYSLVDFAIKVVGVGSVGTRCFIVLMEGEGQHDPLFLQIKEATSSVLEDHLPPSPYQNHGQRVVEGQRLMQAASDIFLGWTRSLRGPDYYVRHLKDMKGSARIDTFTPKIMQAYARACGWTLARAHACSGDPVAISGYLGSGQAFDAAIAEFAEKYADQNERDYAAFSKAIRSGRIEAHSG